MQLNDKLFYQLLWRNLIKVFDVSVNANAMAMLMNLVVTLVASNDLFNRKARPAEAVYELHFGSLAHSLK